MITDLRSYLEVLKTNNELLHITKEVDSVREIGAVMATLERTGGEAAFFSNVKGFAIPVAGGPFITGGITFSRAPEGGRQNLSFHRMQIKGPDKSGVMINEWRHLREFLSHAEEQNKPLPIAVAVGLDPVILIAAGIKSDLDEIELAGALRGRPIPMAKCVTSDIMVPADAEFVIEGEIRPGEREKEGPLAEFTGH